MKRNNNKKYIIMGLITIVCVMTVAYGAFLTNLNITGTTNITSKWEILITNVTQTDKQGRAEQAKEPTWEALTANMEANLYEKGDSITFDVTIENKGTLDAYLYNVNKSITSNNEAIIIDVTGFTKGEKLLKQSKKTIQVTMKYNPEFNGIPEIGSTELSVGFEYSQAEGGTITPEERYLLKYDYITNGGKSSEAVDEYLKEGTEANLEYEAEKEGYQFVGWNTDPKAHDKLETYQTKGEENTLYAKDSRGINITNWSSNKGYYKCLNKKKS